MYDWRIRAENGGGVSAWQTATFVVTPDSPGESALLTASPTATATALPWAGAWPAVLAQDYESVPFEGTSTLWQRSAPNQTLTSDAVRSGDHAWKIEA